jgi:16S rRNA (uracil1498-N3)-methyltransferase
MSRFFLDAAEWGGEAWLEGDEARHLGQVLRGQPGKHVWVFDGQGRRAEAEILEVAKTRVRLKLGKPVAPPPLRPEIILAQAIPKGKMMETIVQKAVELGVREIQPLLTEHTVSRPSAHKAEKWRRTALEACKQCGQDLLPAVHQPAEIDAWLASLGADPGGDELRVIASLAPGARPMREVLRSLDSPPRRAVLLVGPEGDFSPPETTAALEAGFRPVSLGRIVLRVETASLFCLSAMRYEFATDENPG